MEPVKLTHPEGYILGLLLPVSLLPVVVEPVHTLSFWDILLFCSLGIVGIFGLYRAASWEQLDEAGIAVKRPFSRKLYPWTQVQKIRLVPFSTTRGRYPRFLITLPSRTIPIRCTKASLAAVERWYGEPDEDNWGRGIE